MDTYAADVAALTVIGDLKRIDAPTLVTHGDDDQIVPYADFGSLC